MRMTMMMNARLLGSLLIPLFGLIAIASGASRLRRGIPVSGANLDDQRAAAEYARKAGDAAIAEINGNEQVARYSASSAVGTAVGRDYQNQLATTAQFVAQFTAPVTKEQASNVFNTISNFHKAGDVSSALASNTGAIHRAANSAASSNYQQAYQAEQGGYQRGGGGGHGGGGGGGGSGGYGGGGGSSSWS